jgi:glycosyltransferase involved in cell wall biosynthesis
LNNLISVITINLNNLKGLQKTVESVLLQDYQNIEYLIIDGGSKDGSVEYLKSNEKRVDYWVSENDQGIYDAMNKGILKSTGDYILFLNSGDYFFTSDSLRILIEQSKNEDIIYGNMILETMDNREVKKYPSVLSIKYFQYDTIPHPCTLIRRELFFKYGFYSTKYKIISDWAFFIDTIIKHKVSYAHIDNDISVFNLYGISSQSSSYKVIRREMNLHFKENYFFYFWYAKLMWSLKYYPKRTVDIVMSSFKSQFST